MTFSEAVKTCFSKFLTFSGRASRPEYWFFFLFIVIWNVIAGIIDWQFFTQVTTTQAEGATSVTAVSNQPVQSIVGLIVFFPHLAVAFRRMHDTGRSGLYALLPILLTLGAFAVLFFGIGIASQFDGGTMDILLTRATLLIVIPTLLVLFVSPLLVLWWLTRPSQPGTNQYGPNPYEVAQ